MSEQFARVPQSVRISLLLLLGLCLGWNASLRAEEASRPAWAAEDSSSTFALVITQVGQGTLEQNPSGTQLEAGTTVTLTAQPETGWAFGGWSFSNGSSDSTSNPLVFTLESDTTVTAHFDRIIPSYTLRTGKVGRGTVSRKPDQPAYAENTTVTVTATATEGYEFTHWTGDVPAEQATQPVLTLTMDRNRAVTANFEWRYYVIYKLFLESSEWGVVSVSPDQLGFFAGTTVTLTATPKPGCRFIGWTGVPASQKMENPVVLTMNSDKRVAAQFEKIVVPETFALTLTADGDGTVTAQPSLPAYLDGTTVTVTATPAEGHFFSGWSGDFPAGHEQDNPLLLTLTTTLSLTAHFAVQPIVAPTSLTATTGTFSYKVETAWDAVTSATHYRLWRAAEGGTDPVDLTGWQTATTFRDESVTPGVTYHYWVQAAANATGFRASALTGPVAGWAAGNPMDEKVYRVTYRDCQILTDTPTSSCLLFTNVGNKASVKVTWMKRGVPVNARNKPGTQYVTARTIPQLRVEGSLTSLYCDAPVTHLEVTGVLKRLTANDEIQLVEASGAGTIQMKAQKNALASPPEFARTSILMAQNWTPMVVQTSGVVIEYFNVNQPVKSLRADTKKYVDPVSRQKRVSLGGFGPVERVRADAWGQGSVPTASEGSGLYAISIGQIRAVGGSIVVDEIVAPTASIEATSVAFDTASGRVVAQGNIRAVHIESATVLKRLGAKGTQPKGGTLTGGFIGYPGVPQAMRVLFQDATAIEGQSGVSGVFVAGYQGPEGSPIYTGSIRSITTKANAPEGEAHISPLAPAIQFKPNQGGFVVKTEFSPAE
ncbi:MAG TPA: InlB B-repeat-containing protein [Candidatus Sumerlaeota bacterium]|nr:InlB B-repeat-containing protein [Candidatus Sumerlaeota bacterium]